MSDREFLFEGGAAGHMNHLYDNPDLSFAKLKEIFSAAAAGKLEGTEKTDGQNLMISFSVKEGRAKGVRNKGDIKAGGLTPEQLAAKFADRANPALKETFSDALRAFEKTVQGLSHDEQVTLFGSDANIFYNAEVMDPRTPNVINYDTKTLVIHRAGHIEYDRQEEKITGRDLSQEAGKLEKAINDSQEQLKHDSYGVQMNAIKRLKALSDKRPLNSAISKINTLLSNVNSLVVTPNLQLNETSTVGEYMIARVYILINQILKKGGILSFDPYAKMSIAKRILGVKGISVKDISSKVSKEQMSFVKENLLSDSSRKEILKTAIMPLESIVSDFAVEMLKGLQSAFVVDNTKEVQRLKNELQIAIDTINASGNEEAMTILKRQMQKLKNVENVDAAAEGFVFDHDGVTYKFTGNFAPMNQILGLFKYGRGSVPPLQKISEAKKKTGETVAVIPGAFKPPHKGHLAMVKAYAKLADRVIVMVSPISRDLPTGQPVTFDISSRIWNTYLESEGLTDRVTILNSPFSSPVRAAYEFVENKENRPDFAQPGQTVILGTSTKGGDQSRFAVDAATRSGVNVIVKPLKPLGNISASDMRKAIASGNKDQLAKYLPDSVNKKKTALEIISMFNVQQKLSENVLYDTIIEQAAKRGNKYYLLFKKVNKLVKQENAMSAGSITGASSIEKEKMEQQ